MIEGTKPFRKKSDAAPILNTNISSENNREAASVKSLEEIYPSDFPPPSPSIDAPNPSRREWFAGLAPAFGEGLVKILRESNHLKRELSEIMREKNQDK